MDAKEPFGRPPQSHTQFEHTCVPALYTPVLGEPNERAAFAPAVSDVEFCATPGKPKLLAAPAFACAPGSEPKNLAAPIAPAVPLGGGWLTEVHLPLALWLALRYDAAIT